MIPTFCHVCGTQAFQTCKLCGRGYCSKHSGPSGLCSACYDRGGGKSSTA